jgi:hypothetical protein
MPKVRQAISVVEPKVVRCLQPIGKVPHWAVIGMSLMRLLFDPSSQAGGGIKVCT